jgi:hypothetical protein
MQLFSLPFEVPPAFCLFGFIIPAFLTFVKFCAHENVRTKPDDVLFFLRTKHDGGYVFFTFELNILAWMEKFSSSGIFCV